MECKIRELYGNAKNKILISHKSMEDNTYIFNKLSVNFVKSIKSPVSLQTLQIVYQNYLFSTEESIIKIQTKLITSYSVSVYEEAIYS